MIFFWFSFFTWNSPVVKKVQMYKKSFANFVPIRNFWEKHLALDEQGNTNFSSLQFVNIYRVVFSCIKFVFRNCRYTRLAALESNSKSSWPSWKCWVTVHILECGWPSLECKVSINYSFYLLLICELILSAKFQFCYTPPFGGWPFMGWWLTILGMISDHLWQLSSEVSFVS